MDQHGNPRYNLRLLVCVNLPLNAWTVGIGPLNENGFLDIPWSEWFGNEWKIGHDSQSVDADAWGVLEINEHLLFTLPPRGIGIGVHFLQNPLLNLTLF